MLWQVTGNYKCKAVYVLDMVQKTEYRVISDLEGHITQYDDKERAEEAAEHYNKMDGVPDDHGVVEYTHNY